MKRKRFLVVFIKGDDNIKSVVSEEYSDLAEAMRDILDSFSHGGITDCAILDRRFQDLVGPESFVSDLAARPRVPRNPHAGRHKN